MTKIQQLIEQHGGSAALARKIGKSRRTVESWKYGNRNPDELTLYGIDAMLKDCESR